MTQISTEQRLRECEAIRARFTDRGQSIAEWARRHGVSPSAAYDYLYGRTSGRKGESRKVAELLGHGEGEA